MLGYYEIEHIDDPCILTIAAHPTEYFEMFEVKKNQQKTQRNKFENFSKRIKLVVNFDTFEKPQSYSWIWRDAKE